MTDTEENAIYRALSNWESASISRCFVVFARWRRLGCGDKFDGGMGNYNFTCSTGRYDFTDNPVRFISASWVYYAKRDMQHFSIQQSIKPTSSRKALR